MWHHVFENALLDRRMIRAVAGDEFLDNGPQHRRRQFSVNDAHAVIVLHGNVWEWCSDWLGDYASTTVTDPTGPPSGSLRVLRGGSWDFDVGNCRSASRLGEPPFCRFFSFGFRLASSSVDQSGQ